MGNAMYGYGIKNKRKENKSRYAFRDLSNVDFVLLIIFGININQLSP
jgi:hypothetical protein